MALCHRCFARALRPKPLRADDPLQQRSCPPCFWDGAASLGGCEETSQASAWRAGAGGRPRNRERGFALPDRTCWASSGGRREGPPSASGSYLALVGFGRGGPPSWLHLWASDDGGRSCSSYAAHGLHKSWSSFGPGQTAPLGLHLLPVRQPRLDHEMRRLPSAGIYCWLHSRGNEQAPEQLGYASGLPRRLLDGGPYDPQGHA